VAAVTAVLSLYEPDLIREVTDPRTGICTTEKHASFLPNAGEIKLYCEGIAARRERVARLSKLPAPDPGRHLLSAPDPRPGDKATVFVPIGHARYGKLVAWSQEADTDQRKWRYGKSSDNREGIWISWDVWDQQAPAPMRTMRTPDLSLSEATLRAMREVDAEPFSELPVDHRAAE